MSRRGGVKNGRSNNISEAEGLVYDKLIRAKLAYKIPDTMDIGKQYVVEVIITKQLLDNVLYYGFYKNISKDFVLIDSIAISSRVKVSLIDPEEKNFQIKPMNTELQVVDSKSSTAWKWYIRPKTGGYNPLILTVSTRIKDQYGSDYKDIPVFEKTVNVNSNYWYSTRIFLEENWQYVLSGILIPFIVWLFNLYNNKERGSKQGKKVKTYNKRV